MNLKIFLVNTALILSMLGCKGKIDSNSSMERITSDTLVPSIPERPSEIEIIDLTGDVALFVVVAGAYSTESGAQKKADTLKKAGFANAGVVQRPGSKLFSALVERFDTESAAENFASDLATNNEIKSYVYKLDE